MLDQRQENLIQNCITYANNNPAGMPGHNLALLVAAMHDELVDLRGRVKHGDYTALVRENGLLKKAISRIVGSALLLEESAASIVRELDTLDREARNRGNAN